MTEAQMALLRDLIEGAKKKGGLSRCLEWLRFCPPEYREKMDRLFLDALEGAFRELSRSKDGPMTEAMREAANRPKFSIMTVSNAIEGGYDAVLKECGAGISGETKKALLAYNHYLRAVLVFEKKAAGMMADGRD